jgi:outer membrane biosynthesis protein TonB
MSTREYVDFDLQIESSGEGYRARVINSPVGQAMADFDIPLSDMEQENFILKLNRPRRGVRRIESQHMEAAKEFGGILFGSVFQGEVLSSLQSSMTEASKNGAGLRIRLRLSGAPDLLDLPWEFLYDRSLNRFLALSVDSPLVRYLDMPGYIAPLEVTPPLRVLVMISSPEDVPTLDTEEEWRKLKEAVQDLEAGGLLVLERLEKPTLGALQHALRRNDYHIFHFIGHGGFDEINEDGILLLEDDHKRSRKVSGQDLGIILHDEKTLRLAVLNSCEGGRTSRNDPFVGVGQSLLQQGIPAVIAMQFEISDEAAIKMSHEFYYSLADAYPVDAALAEARKAIYADVNDVEWGTPVLYLRAADGRIFDIDKSAAVAVPSPELAAPGVAAGVAVSAAQPVVSRAAVEPMAAPEFEGAGQVRGASSVPATPARAAPATTKQSGAGGRSKLWLALGAVLAVVIIGAGILLLGGLGGGSEGDLAEAPGVGLVDETATVAANNTPTAAPTVAPTDEPTEVAVIVEEPEEPVAMANAALTTTIEAPEATPEPTDTVEPTPEPADTLEPASEPTDTPEPIAEPTSTPPPAEPTNTSAPAAPVIDGRIAYSAGGELHIADAATGKDSVKPIRNMFQPSFGPHGTELLANGEGGELTTMVTIDANSGAIIRQQTTFTNDFRPFWSPDAKEFTYDSLHHGLGNYTMLYTQKITDREPEPDIPLGHAGQQISGFSPVWTENNSIAFTGCDYWPGGTFGDVCGLYVMPSSGGEPSLLHQGSQDMRATDNDGNQLVFMSQETGDWEVFSIPVSGGQVRNLSQSSGSHDGLGTFSPDGRSVAFVSDRGGSWAIWAVKLDGTGLTKLFNLPAAPAAPWYEASISWGP